uniref:uncharacterized protein n=1 Tax=Myxine glutinosa TaxID=7769 RepID=UPI00358F6F10
MTVVKELNEGDWISRRELCENILQRVPEDAVLLCSDEAHFHLSGSVNKQNFSYCSEDKPRMLHERPLHSDRVTVWCVVADVGIVGPYFFEEGGVTVTITSDRYIDMLENFLRPQLEHLDLEELDVWFQQDGATAHTARRSLQVLREMFPDQVMWEVFLGENDILIHCDGIDGEKQKLFFEGILHHRVELFTLKRNTMLLTCQTAEEVNTILATGKYKIDGKELHIEARNGSSFDIDAYHVKLEGLDENTPLKLVTSFIEQSSGCSHLDFNVDYAKNGKAAIITFLQPIAWKGFQKACSSRKLHNRDILATPMQMTKWLFVEGLPSNITMAALHQYFQREAEICGGDINNILMTKDNQMAYLQFDSSEGAKQVLAKKHCLEQTSLQMYRYNIEENIVVRGCRTVDVEFPKKVTCHIDHNILKLMLKNSVFTEYIERKFGSISAQLLFYPPTSIDVIPTFNIGTIPSLNLSQHWRSAVHKILEETMSRFGEKTFAVSHPEVWSRAWEEIAPLMDNSRIISFDLSSLNIHLHGEVKDLRITGEKLQKAVEKAHQDIQLDPNYIERIPHLEFSTPNFNTKKKISLSRKTKGFI